MSKSFQDLSIADLVQVYNSLVGEMAGVKPVKSFRTKADGQKRVLAHMSEDAALERLDGIDGVEPSVELTMDARMELDLSDPRHPLHVSPEEQVRRNEARKSLPPAQPMRAFGAVIPEHQRIVSAAEPKRPRRKDVDSLVVVVLAAENPHRIKSSAGQRFAMFKSGQTVEEYVASWARVGIPSRMDKKRARRAKRQVRKDLAKGHIKLVTRGEWLKSQEKAVAA